MIFPVQNSYSFSLIQAWGGEMNKQREADKPEDWGSANQQHWRRRQQWFLYLLGYQTHLNAHSAQHMLSNSKHEKVKTRSFFLACWISLGRKRFLAKNRILSFHKELRGLLLLCWPRLKIPHISYCFCQRHKPEPYSSVAVWMKPQMAEPVERRPHRLRLPPPVLLMDYQAFSCSSAEIGILPWDDDWTVITGEMGGPNFWFNAWNSHFVHFHVILGDRWHMIEHYMNHLNTRHMEFCRAFMHCE